MIPVIPPMPRGKSLSRVALMIGCNLFFLVSMVAAQAPPPDFVSEIMFTINEQLEPGIYVGNIAAESRLGQNNGYSFKLVGANEALLTLNLTTGELQTGRVIDREVECRNEIQCVKEYSVTAYKDAVVYTIKIQLNVTDINDETPTFEPKNMTLRLSELTPINTMKPLRSAVDLDKGPNNGVALYEFSSFILPIDVSHFELVVNMTTNTVNLNLVKELDHETKSRYQLHVLAKDAGNPIRTGTLTVDIEVIDENDNKPEFEHSKLNISVTEDISVGKSIVTLKASDKDSGKFGQVQYALLEPTTYLSEHFSVNATSGELKVKQKLNYEAGNSQKTIYIVASDRGETALSSTATVLLTIKDAGNNPPKITTTILGEEKSPNELLVSESSSIDKAIMYISVSDTDSGDNGNVSCSIVNTYFGIKRNNNPNDNSIAYRVFVQHELDHETKPEHNLTVRCYDLGGLSTSKDFKVTVTDENDNTPVFERFIYYANIAENNTYGAEILRLKATDEDSGRNAEITYQVNQTKDFEIVVENDVAVVRAITVLDREKYQQKVFQVFAIDNGNPKLTGQATVQLDIQDINDMKPEFTNLVNHRYEFHVAEGLESNTHVDYVTAIDEDQGDNQRLKYEMVPKYAENGRTPVPFIVLGNGEIKTTMELDREKVDSYLFQVRAVDFGKPAQSSTVDVFVFVDDKNDNNPVFLFPTETNNTINAFNEVSDSEITTLLAMDQDNGINHELIYFIVEGDPNGIFSLDANSGKLYIIKYVQIAADQKYTLLVSVYDKGKPPLADKQMLIVNLKSTNGSQGLKADDEENSSYVIIVVTVVCITCLLSITIITVICLIRRKDIHKCGVNGKIAKNIHIPSLANKLVGRKTPSEQALSNDKTYPPENGQRNKKEVSFSLDDRDSLSSNDYKNLTLKEKGVFSSRQTTLHDTPEEGGEISLNQPVSILRPQPFNQSQANKFYDHPDVHMNVNHQREDSHSETSGETTTSHDSGKGGSVEGDHPEPRFNMDILNPSAYLIKEGPNNRPPAVYPPAHRNVPPNTLPLKTDLQKSSVHYSDKQFSPKSHVAHNSHTWNNPKRCHNLNSSSSYPDSDYQSTSSNLNFSQGHLKPSRDSSYQYSANNSFPSPIHTGYNNPAYDFQFRCNSTRDDDETTTTSGSYTINHEDVDDELRYRTSQVV
ncbi:protocadherin beta-16-like isoform X2 [Mya arenaria]|uniref:protocadherin beta-16-like isoform X2 n=1 Tax=Mya arenaria TaxID=6604 RepID=UPI0022E26DAB|nr:protocadherin beta-16-like isoform X2 [Mya arenaria]